MSKESAWINKISSCLRSIGENNRIYPMAKRIEVVFIVEAGNYLLLRTEGPGDINAVTLPESGHRVPVILPEKLQAVTRRTLLQLLRNHYNNHSDEVNKFIRKAQELGFTKASEHLKSGWNCTIQPPLASGGEKATDLGMDGYCPSCTIFGVALTSQQLKPISGMSVGIKTRIHFDPAFATVEGILPATHNKVSEGMLSTTGQSLYTEIHVEPGTIFIGRAVITDVTLPELLAVLGSLIHVEEIGGRSGVYGTVKIRLAGIRCGTHSSTTALELADNLAGSRKPSEILSKLGDYLKKYGFIRLTNEDVEEVLSDNTMLDLWKSSIDFAEQMVKWISFASGKKK
ncbi:MAG: type I-D CRISPR-associated protein Cas7/Csc2 [Desulfurococcales archaeon]|nr:type I-D CRISPR-associated protein Cas7/Csc2 [Desulfurococcales archaeon]